MNPQSKPGKQAQPKRETRRGNNGADQGQPVLAKCPDCEKNGGCILGIRAAFKIPKTRCPATGLPRTKIYDATSPKPENNFKPPVESYELKKKGAKTGHRIVLGASFSRYIRSHKTQPNTKFQDQLPKSLRKRTRKKGTVEAPARSAEFAAKQKRHERKVSAEHENSRNINQASGIPLDGAPAPGSVTRTIGGGGAHGFDEL